MNVSAPFITRPIATSLLGVRTQCARAVGLSHLPALPEIAGDHRAAVIVHLDDGAAGRDELVTRRRAG